MDKLQLDLLKYTILYTTLKKKLEAVERKYAKTYAQMYLQERIMGMKTEEMRKNELVLLMENEHGKLMDELQTLRGDTRTAYYQREAIAIILGGKKE